MTRSASHNGLQTQALYELSAYLRLVWRAMDEHPGPQVGKCAPRRDEANAARVPSGPARGNPNLQTLRRWLQEMGSRVVAVQVFDSAGSTHARLRFTRSGFEVLGVVPTGTPDWIVSRRYLADVLSRPALYLQNPARLDLGWLAPRGPGWLAPRGPA